MPSITANIQPETHKIGVIGLPLLLAYINKGFHAIGFDIDNTKTEKILAGESYIKHISAENIAKAAETGRLHVTTDFTRVVEVDALILCVPTPLDHHLEPDLSYVRSTLDNGILHLKPASIISLESTTYPGTTEEEILPRLQQRGLIPGETIFVVYSPEREDPGNPIYHSTNIPKVVGGHTAHCLEQGVALYRAAFDQIVPVSST
jgi:UDP-N-acetyl-D-glucosamine dehydrogenase